ncbi:MAG TPA: hypothetical protein VF337_00220 [Candidatus Limnocylindrales bacterium]
MFGGLIGLRKQGRMRLVGLGFGAALVAILVWQVAGGSGGDPQGDPQPSLGGGSSSPSLAAFASPSSSAPGPSATFTADPSVAPTPTASPRPSATPRPTARPTAAPTRTDRPWSQGATFLQAKSDGRVTLDAKGDVAILDAAPAPATYAAALSLNTAWSGLIQEPPRSGYDDNGASYTDFNYSLFCGAGTGAVVLYYWPASKAAVTTKAGTFKEPVNLGTSHYSSTYWKAEDGGGYARGMILYLAEVEWPTPDVGMSWWLQPGIMTWSAHPPSTDVKNLIDAINWEASGRSRLDYFYVAVPASQLTAVALRDHVHADIAMGVPVVVAARTSDGTSSLPFWKVKARGTAANHFVTVVGYDDAAGTYAVMDTCGVTCNDQNTRAGVRNISQAALFALIVAESDNDGIMW